MQVTVVDHKYNVTRHDGIECIYSTADENENGIRHISFRRENGGASLGLAEGFTYDIEGDAIWVRPIEAVVVEDDTDWQQIALDLSVAIQEFANADERNRNTLADKLTRIRRDCPAD